MKTAPQKRILLIDDSKDNQALLKLALESKGYSVVCTSNGAEGIGKLREPSALPDLILLDAQMPVMDGYEFRRQQLADGRLSQVPVVVMSAEEGPEMNWRMGNPFGVMLKPLNLNKVFVFVSSALHPVV